MQIGPHRDLGAHELIKSEEGGSGRSRRSGAGLWPDYLDRLSMAAHGDSRKIRRQHRP
jgi:hypothetical protein